MDWLYAQDRSFIPRIFGVAAEAATIPVAAEAATIPVAPIPDVAIIPEARCRNICGTEDVSHYSIEEKRIYCLFLLASYNMGNVDQIGLNGEVIWTKKQGG